MKVTLHSKKLQESGFELIDEVFEEHCLDYGVPESLKNNIFYNIYQNLMPEIEEECNKHLERYSYFMDSTIKAFPQINFPTEKKIIIYFVPEDFYKKTIVNHYSNRNHDLSKSIGLFSVSGGEGISKSMETFFNDEFVILISVPNNQEMKKILNESKFKAVSSMVSILNTLTHELNHALLFILNSSGLTPAEIDDLWECSEYNLCVNDCAQGEFFIRDEVCYIGSVHTDKIKCPEELMEFYVEETGKDFIYNLKSYKNGKFESYIKNYEK